jgi:phytoene synthase
MEARRMRPAARPSVTQSSFYWALRLMPRERRDAMLAVYRYCRTLDDIADGEALPETKLELLASCRTDLAALFAGGEPTSPVISALKEPIARFGVEHEPLEALIAGMEMDARGEMHAPPLARFERYCYCVAGAVGLVAIKLFGTRGDQARAFALALGGALQITNVLRDLDEDAARGRLYLPAELLDRAGIRVRRPAEVLTHAALPDACEALADLADERYRAALEHLPVDPRPFRPAIVMMVVYRRLLERLRGTGWRAPRPAVRVPEIERFWIALRHLGPPVTWPSST